MMKIGVCIKQVPDTAMKLKVKDDHSGIVEENIKYVMNPYDEFAVEEALRTKEKVQGSEITVFSVGPKRCQEAIRTALAMGCDNAVHINSDVLDSMVVARILSSQIKETGIELLFTGRHAVDDDNAQVSQMIAEFLDWPCVTMVSEFELTDGNAKAKVSRDVEGGAKEVWQVQLPGVFAANKGLNEPRYAALKGIMQAKKKPLKEVTPQDCGVDAGHLNAKLVQSNFGAPPERGEGKIFTDDMDKAVSEVVRLLREEAKAI